MQKPFKTTLSNGLRVVLLESHVSPVISINLWANVGSVNETPDQAGICHLIEHMLFKGTSRRAVGEIAKEVEAAGGDMNAYTSFDETVFYINMASKRQDVGLDILADAALDPTFDEEELTREKEVVVEEISRSEDNPSQMTSHDLFGKSFLVHPYGRPIAGTRETVRAISRQTLLDFYKRWYVGSNLILVVVGDFKTEEILEKITALYSKIPSGTAPIQNIPVEPSQLESRLVMREMSVEGRYLDLGFHIPELTHPDIAALDLLSHILGGGASSRLERFVKDEKGLVTSIGAFAYTPRHPCMMIVGAVLKEKALKETIQSIWESIELIKEQAPTTVEFARARENLKSSKVYEKRTVEALARKLAYFEGIAGDIEFEHEYDRRLSEVTPEDIQAVARKYLRAEKVTVSFCHPQSEVWKESTLKEWLPVEKVVKNESAKLVSKKSDLRVLKLPNGVKILVQEAHHIPLVAIRSASLGGLRNEDPRRNGISHLLTSLLMKGTTHRTARELDEQIENISGHMDAFTGRNLMGLQASFLSEKVAEAFDLFFDVLLHPSFPEEEIKKEKSLTYTSIRNEVDSPSGIAMKKFMASLYGKHPYALPILGTIPTVKAITRNELIKLYRQTFHPQNLVISVVGDVHADDIFARIKEKLAHWKPARVKISKVSPPKLLQKPVSVLTKSKKLQAHIVYGFLGTTVTAKDKYALDVLNSVLSGQGGRLFLELRDKQSLAYTVTAFSQEGIEPGYLGVYMGTDPVKLDQALEGIRSELNKVTRDLIPEAELERAKRFIIGNYELDLQKNESIASLLAFHEVYGLPRNEIQKLPDYIEKITAEDVRRVAKKYFTPQASVLSIVRI